MSTRQMRRPALKLVLPTDASQMKQDSRIMHDARGTAVWVGEPSVLEDVSSLTLAVEPSATRAIEGDPYNRPATTLAGRNAAPTKSATAKQRR